MVFHSWNAFLVQHSSLSYWEEHLKWQAGIFNVTMSKHLTDEINSSTNPFTSSTTMVIIFLLVGVMKHADISSRTFFTFLLHSSFCCVSHPLYLHHATPVALVQTSPCHCHGSSLQCDSNDTNKLPLCFPNLVKSSKKTKYCITY